MIIDRLGLGSTMHNKPGPHCHMHCAAKLVPVPRACVRCFMDAAHGCPRAVVPVVMARMQAARWHAATPGRGVPVWKGFWNHLQQQAVRPTPSSLPRLAGFGKWIVGISAVQDRAQCV